jgi:hypothetical protein
MPEVKSIRLNFDDGTTRDFFPPIVPLPPDPPKPTVWRQNVGVNLPAVRYYSSDRPFANLRKCLSHFTPVATTWNTGLMPPMDELGWPQGRMSSGYLATLIDLKKGHPKGLYNFSADGNVRLAGQTSTFPKLGDEMRALFEIRDPLTRFDIWPSSGEKANGDFLQGFVDSLNGFKCLRFMNWNQTNNLTPADVAHFGARITPEHFSQAVKEVAIEHQIDLCNLTGQPFWYNFHHAVSNDYVQSVAGLVVGRLRPEIPIYVEYTNEAWNGQFKAHQWCVDRSPETRNPMEYHLIRTAQIGQLFENVVPRARVVLGSFTFGHSTLDWIIERAKLQSYAEMIGYVSIAPYFGHGVTEATKLAAVNGDLSGIFRDCESDITAVLEHVERWLDLCDARGWYLNAYEAGQHVSPKMAEQGNVKLVEAFANANRHEEMYRLYKLFLTGWEKATDGALINLFESCSLFDKYGCWGLKEYYGQPISETPKLRAVQDYIRRVF